MSDIESFRLIGTLKIDPPLTRAQHAYLQTVLAADSPTCRREDLVVVADPLRFCVKSPLARDCVNFSGTISDDKRYQKQAAGASATMVFTVTLISPCGAELEPDSLCFDDTTIDSRNELKMILRHIQVRFLTPWARLLVGELKWWHAEYPLQDDRGAIHVYGDTCFVQPDQIRHRPSSVFRKLLESRPHLWNPDWD